MLDASPTARLLTVFWSRRLNRVALAALAVLFALATYAPLLSGAYALLTYGPQGWSLPLWGALWNRWYSPFHHDVVFNLLGLLLPLLLGLWRFLTPRWGVPVVLRGFVVLWISLALLVLLPAPWRVPLAAVPWLLLLPRKACLLLLLGTVALGLWDQQGRAWWRHRAMPAATVTWQVTPLIPHAPDRTYPGANLLPPLSINPATGARLWLGGDVRGRDVAVRLLHGARLSLTVGFLAAGLALAIGLVVGAVSGYVGGWFDLLTQRLVEVVMTVPVLIILLQIASVVGRDVFVMVLVLGLFGWTGTARLVRGEFLAQGRQEYVLAARALGLPTWRILFRHILPNVMTPVLISATFGVAGAIGLESTLAFLGLGDPNAPSWGEILDQGRQNRAYAWLIYAPGLTIFSVVLLLYYLGDQLRQAADVRGQA
jgi:peptide/nickel transport system permease protein